jgi:hypothetical protein
MTFESYEVRKQVKIGAKLTLIGGIFFVVAFVVHGSQLNLGFEEQSLLSLVMMASMPVWVIGGVCFGVAADNWLINRRQSKRY